MGILAFTDFLTEFRKEFLNFMTSQAAQNVVYSTVILEEIIIS